MRDYLRLPPGGHDKVGTYLAAAWSKARSAGIPDFENNAQYDMFILALAALYYDNRGLSFSGTYQNDKQRNTVELLNSFVLELRHAKNDDGSEPGGIG